VDVDDEDEDEDEDEEAADDGGERGDEWMEMGEDFDAALESASIVNFKQNGLKDAQQSGEQGSSKDLEREKDDGTEARM